MGESAVDARAAMERMKDELPEEEKDGNVGKIITYAMNLLQSGSSFRQAQQQIGELYTLGQHVEALEQLPEVGREALQEVCEFRQVNSTESWIDSYLNHLSETVSLDETESFEGVAPDEIPSASGNTNKLILDSVKKYHQDRCNELITEMAKGSAVVAACQALKLYIAWKKISEASNVVSENKNEFTAVNRNLERLKRMVLEFLDLCDRQPDDRSIAQRMTKINTLFTSTLGKVSNLKVKIDGHIQRLDLLADYSAIDGVVNLATVATRAFQLWNTWEMLTNHTKALATASAAVFTVLGLGNFGTFYLSRNALKDLRKDLNEAQDLQDRLQELHEQAAEAMSVIPE